MRILLHDCDIHTGSATDATPGAAAPIRFADEWHAREFVRRHFRDACELVRLRAALGADLYGLPRVDDEDVIRTAARRLASGAWRAHGAAAAPANRPAQDPAPRPASGAALRTGQAAAPRSAAPARAAAPARPAPAAASPPAQAAPAAEWPELSDHVAQAAALEQAASKGLPFCEICARRAQATAGTAA